MNYEKEITVVNTWISEKRSSRTIKTLSSFVIRSLHQISEIKPEEDERGKILPLLGK
jgi:hypothetical protein